MIRFMIALTALGAISAAHAAEKAPVILQAKSACSENESWTMTPEIREDFAKEFSGFLSGKGQVRGFANGMALRRIAQTREAKAFAEYWVSRSLQQAGLVHIAHNGFASIASREPLPETIGIQSAALECLLRIQERYPAISLPQSVSERIPDYLGLAQGRNKTVAWEAAHSLLRAQLSADRPARETVEKTLAMLSGGGAFENFGRALWAAKRGEHGSTIRELDKFFAQSVIPQPLKRFTDAAHIVLARAHYTRGNFEKASDELKLVSKRSNELANSLSELSWTYLQNDKHAEAIGTALNLQQGGLRHTFAPEAPMVMAMALNELCQYPESVRATNVFKKHYEGPFTWLYNWNHDAQRRDEPLYPLAVEFLKRDKKASRETPEDRARPRRVPDKVASEWVRSPLFISSQDEINLLFDEQDGTGKLGRSGSQEQTRAARQTVAQILETRPKLKLALSKRKPGEPLSKSLINELREIKSSLTYFRRVQNAAPVWRTLLANYQKQSPSIKSRLVAQINDDLKDRSQRMLAQLEEIAENIQLVEIEIYNGASQDIIWQNAHPDYKAVAQKIQQEREKAAAEKVWDWGHSKGVQTDDDAEIWEDELGSFKADLFDNCSSKDRYLALKMNRR